MRRYYEARAAEYDEWYLGTGRFADRDRPGWEEELDVVTDVLAALPPARTLDVACGTAFLSRHVDGLVVGLDQSPSMVAIAQRRLPDGVALTGDALELPFADGAFDRVLTGHFYGHLDAEEAATFRSEAARVAGELIVVDSALRDGVQAEEWQERILNDGSSHRVYKRFFDPASLLDELGGGAVLHAGTWFVVARAAA